MALTYSSRRRKFSFTRARTAHQYKSKYADLSLDLGPCAPNKSFFTSRKLQTNFYMTRLVLRGDRTVLKFTCLENFHNVSGDMEMTCVGNGTWTGEEPVCAVDYLKDKLTISFFIILASFFLPVLWLGADFYFWTKKRANIRKITMMPVGDIRKLGYHDWENFQIVKPHRVAYYIDSSSVDTHLDQLSSEHLWQSEQSIARVGLSDDVDEHFSRTTLSSRKPQEMASTSRTNAKDLGPQRSLFTMYGTLGRAIYKDFMASSTDSRLNKKQFRRTGSRHSNSTTHADSACDDPI